jgi:hypothetical protein
MVPSLHTIIVSFLSAVQAISSTALSLINIYKRTVHTIKKVHNTPPPHTSPPQSPTRPSPDASAETTPAPSPPTPEAPSTPSVPSPSQSVAASVDSHPNVGTPPPTSPLLPTRAPPRNLTRPSLLLFAELFSLPTRFAGMALLFICDALVTAFSSFLDRYGRPPSTFPVFLSLCLINRRSSLLPLFLYSSVLTPVQITALVAATKHSLFPNGYPALTPPDPTPEEQAVLRSELLRRLAQAIPSACVIDPFYFYVLLTNAAFKF